MAARLTSNQALRDTETRSKALARASVLRSIAGRLRVLAELATGTRLTSNEPPGTLLNPSGDVGVNMSGPPWGSAWRCAHVVGGAPKPDASAFSFQRPLTQPLKASGVTLSTSFEIQQFDRRSGAPLSQLSLILTAHCVSGSAQPLTVSIRSASGFYHTATLSVASTAEQTFEPASLFLDAVPGRNDVILTFESSSATGVVVDALALNCVAKREILL